MGDKLTAKQQADVEHLTMVFARSFPGWNDDVTEPTIGDPTHRAMLEAHWEKVNATCVREGRKLAKMAVRAGYGRQPETLAPGVPPVRDEVLDAMRRARKAPTPDTVREVPAPSHQSMCE